MANKKTWLSLAAAAVWSVFPSMNQKEQGYIGGQCWRKSHKAEHKRRRKQARNKFK
jgi:hypothetical protein